MTSLSSGSVQPHREAVPEISLLGFPAHPMTGDEVIGQVATAVADRRRLIVANLNTHAMASMFKSQDMARLLIQRDTLVMLDSMPMLFLANMLGHRLSRAKRTTSLDFYSDMFKLAAQRGWRIGYVGGTAEVIENGLATLRHRYPGLDIDGRNGFFNFRKSEDAAYAGVVSWLQERAHDVVIVGMGMPRQEEWIMLVQHRVPTSVFLPAGAYLDYQVGAQKLPPRWLGQIGIEWAYRLVHSPRRLAYRYLVEPIVLLYWLLVRPHPLARARVAD